MANNSLSGCGEELGTVLEECSNGSYTRKASGTSQTLFDILRQRRLPIEDLRDSIDSSRAWDILQPYES